MPVAERGLDPDRRRLAAADGLLLDALPCGEHFGRVHGWVALGAKSDDLVISDPDADPAGRTDAGRVYVLFDTPKLD